MSLEKHLLPRSASAPEVARSLTHAGPGLSSGGAAFAPGIEHRHFNTTSIAPQRQILAWRERVGHIVDIPPARSQVAGGFRGVIDRYAVKDLLFTDSLTDALPLHRTVARISTDNIRNYVFHVVLEGGIGNVAGLYQQHDCARVTPGILALDMNQPFRMQRPACRVLSVFVPRALVESAFPGAESIHGRVIDGSSPLTQIIVAHLAALNRDLATLSAGEADRFLRTAIELLVTAFGKQAGLCGDARAAVRAAMFGQVRRHIDANLHQVDLSPASLLASMRLSRASVYRMFEHEGGLGTYIRHRRLREAADELVRFPQLAVTDIAYGLGFKSASDFTRAFRRAFDMAPMELRQHAALVQRARPKPGAATRQ